MYAGHARTCNPARNTIRDRFDSYGWRGVSSSLPTLPSPRRRETVLDRTRSIFANYASWNKYYFFISFKGEKKRVFN